MPNPVKPSDIEATIPSSTGSICSKLEALFSLASVIKTFWDWAWNEDGTPTDDHVSMFLSPGIVVFWPTATSIPDGWLACNGQTVSRETYANLFSQIGVQFGVGDGSTTFSVPDYRDRFLVGASGTKAAGATGGSDTITLEEPNIPELNISFKAGITKVVVAESGGTNSEAAGAALGRETAEDAFEPLGNADPDAIDIIPKYAAGVWLIHT